MAAVSGNKWTLGVGRQSAKGDDATAPGYTLKATGGDVSPNRTMVQLAETDASRQQGATVVTGGSVGGTPEHYMRPSDFGLLALAALGTIGTTGTTGAYVHTITPADQGMYFSLWKTIAGSLSDKYVDCRAGGLHVAGSAGGIITTSIDWFGRSAEFGVTEPGQAVVSETPLVYPNVTVTRGGSAPGTIEQFGLDIANGGVPIIGDTGIVPYDFVWGKLAVSGTFTQLFESDADYRRFYTGSTTGTALSTTLSQQTLSILIQITAALSVEFVFAGITLNAYGLGPDPSGEPYRAAVGWYSQPQAAIGDYCKIIVKNAVATYPAT